MQTCQRDKETGEILLHPVLSELILQLNKNLAEANRLIRKADKLNREILNLIGKE